MKPQATMGEMASKVQKLEEIMGEFMASSNKKMETITEIVKNNEKEITRKPEEIVKEKPSEEVIELISEEDGAGVKNQNSYAAIASNTSKFQSGLSSQNQDRGMILKKLLQNVMRQNPEKPKQKHKNKYVFHGKAKPDEEDTEKDNLAADVDLVAFGVSTKTEPDQLKAFLVGKGLEIENVECMTRPELLELRLKPVNMQKL